MFPNFELRNVFYTGLSSPMAWIAHQNNMSMKVYIILYSKTGGYRVNLLFLFIFYPVLAKTASSRWL